MDQTTRDPLRELARSHGIELYYTDMTGRRRRSPLESILLVLEALGSRIARPEDAGAALRERRRALERRPVEPVHVAWNGRVPPIELRLPGRRGVRGVCCRILSGTGGGDAGVEKAAIERADGGLARVTIHRTLAAGYHRVALEAGGMEAETLVISAPVAAPVRKGREWGVFLPLHALHSARSAGAGHFGDLRELAEWAGSLGASSVSLLPLLAGFLDEPFEPSPYAPVSRLFWNEMHIDLDLLHEARSSKEVRALLGSPGFRREVRELRALDLVDHRRQMALLRRPLELAAEAFHGSAAAERRRAYAGFLENNPRAADYARFRAACEKRRSSWEAWPALARDGDLSGEDLDESAYRYHLYVQWAAAEQLGGVAREARARGTPLHLDFPLGVHRGGYDVWRWREAFALDASGGCPPDPVFTKGQDWGFPPLHPERLRESGYEYVIEALRAQFRLAGALRIDHAMGLERLYWVPRGLDGRKGVYVRYPREELCAVIALEASTSGAAVVGEDLGTVPPAVRRAMKRHRFHRMYVLQLEARPDPRSALPPAERDMAASLNTHDMPPFAAFWKGLDIDDRRDLGLLDEARAARERKARERLKRLLGAFLAGGELPDAAAAFRACLEAIARGPAWLATVNLEDIWGEKAPQNVPGTSTERPNWRRKARLSLEEIRRRGTVKEILELVSAWRREGEGVRAVRRLRRARRGARKTRGDPEVRGKIG